MVIPDGTPVVLLCSNMADMTALREKIDDAARTVHDIDTNPSTAEKMVYSAKKAKEGLEEIVEILKDIATFLESK